MTVTVSGPDLDPDGPYASVIVDILAQLPFSSRGGSLTTYIDCWPKVKSL